MKYYNFIPLYSGRFNVLFTMHVEMDIDDETRKKVQKYASTFKVKLSRAYAEILELGLELVEAGEFKNTSKVTKK